MIFSICLHKKTVFGRITGTEIFEEAQVVLLTVLMVIDAIISIALIASVLGQEPKSGGMGGFGGGSDTVFSSKARGLDALLARVTVVCAVLFGAVTLAIAKLTI